MKPNIASRVPAPANSWSGKKLKQADLDAVAGAHQRFVERKNGGARALLSSATMSRLNLAGRVFREADFTGADLSGANLAGANLERAILFCADLRDCDARSANMKGVDMRGASLRGADLSFSNLDGADLRAATMLKKDNTGGYSRALPVSANATDGGVDFSNCSMKGASLNEVNLKGANFSNALLQGITFKRARLVDVCLEGAVLTQVNGYELPFSAEILKTCILDPTVQSVARVPELRERLRLHELWVQTNGAEGGPGVVADEDLRPLKTTFRGRELTALSAQRVLAVGVDFAGCQLQGVNFTGADLRDANFEAADLRGAIFRGAKLAHARFGKADLRTLTLKDGQLQKVDLADAACSVGQFGAAIRDTVGSSA